MEGRSFVGENWIHEPEWMTLFIHGQRCTFGPPGSALSLCPSVCAPRKVPGLVGGAWLQEQPVCCLLVVTVTGPAGHSS